MAKKGRKRIKVIDVGSPAAALKLFAIDPQALRLLLHELGDKHYGDLAVCPPTGIYDKARPAGWPAAFSLLKAAGMTFSTQNWNRFCLAVAERPAIAQSTVNKLTWAARKAKDRLSAAERHAVGRRDVFGSRAGRSPRAARSAYRASYRGDRFGAMKIWRPLMEWQPLAGGGWGYVQTGAYSVWQLI